MKERTNGSYKKKGMGKYRRFAFKVVVGIIRWIEKKRYGEGFKRIERIFKAKGGGTK